MCGLRLLAGAAPIFECMVCGGRVALWCGSRGSGWGMWVELGLGSLYLATMILLLSMVDVRKLVCACIACGVLARHTGGGVGGIDAWCGVEGCGCKRRSARYACGMSIEGCERREQSCHARRGAGSVVYALVLKF